VEGLVPDVDRGLDATLLGEEHVAVGDVAFEPLAGEVAPRALTAGLEVGRNAVSGDLDHQVVVVVLVDELPLTGLEAHLPDDHALVLEELLRADLADDLTHSTPRSRVPGSLEPNCTSTFRVVGHIRRARLKCSRGGPIIGDGAAQTSSLDGKKRGSMEVSPARPAEKIRRAARVRSRAST